MIATPHDIAYQLWHVGRDMPDWIPAATGVGQVPNWSKPGMSEAVERDVAMNSEYPILRQRVTAWWL